MSAGETAIEARFSEISRVLPVRVQPRPVVIDNPVARVEGLRIAALVVAGDRVNATVDFTGATGAGTALWCVAAEYRIGNRVAATAEAPAEIRAASTPAGAELSVSFDQLFGNTPSGERRVIVRARVWSMNCSEPRDAPVRETDSEPVCMVRFPLRGWRQEPCREPEPAAPRGPQHP
jgi:hypothetical protein